MIFVTELGLGVLEGGLGWDLGMSVERNETPTQWERP